MIGRLPLHGEHVQVAVSGKAAAAARSTGAGLYRAHVLSDGRYLVALDGDITNLAEAARAEGIEGSPEPARLVLELHRATGAGFLSRLRGEFVLVVHDSTTERVLLARSFIANRPLYFAQQDGRLWFASGMAPIVRQEGYRKAVDRSALPMVLTFRGTFGPRTPFADLRKVVPGCYFEGCVDRPLPCRVFYRPDPPEKSNETAREFGDRIWDALGRSVRRGLRVGEPDPARPALLVSGGIDSALVARKLQELGRTDALAISCGYASEAAAAHDESAAAERTAERSGLPFRRIVTGAADDLLSSLRHAVRVTEEPVRVYIAIPIARALARTEAACDTLLTGTFADVLFGERMHYDTPILDFRRRWPRLASAVRASLPVTTRIPKFGGYARWFRRGDVDDMREYLFVHQRPNGSLRGLLPQPKLEDCAPHLDQLLEQNPGLSAADEYTTIETMMYAYTWNETFGKLAAARSMEAFHPFQSDELYRLALEMPYRGKIARRHTKPYLRELAARLTSRELAYDEKHIFSSPGPGWLTRSEALVSFALALGEPGARVRDHLDRAALDRLIEDYGRKIRADELD
ncbi:MAG TPA: asparagine synthase-related protein, partial [Gemmatimonadota bacterium]|nr:asparagine synthase-related protein [Gemmatimonadota bacterium]